MTCKRSHLFPAVLSISLLLLAACSSISPSANATPPAPASTATIMAVEDLAQAFISAYEARQAADYLALFSNNALYMDNSMPFRTTEVAIPVRNSGSYVRNLFATQNFAMKFDAHYVSRDGRFVALTGTYTNTSKDPTGKPTSVPVVIILEVQDGKIIREDWYYDNSAFV